MLIYLFYSTIDEIYNYEDFEIYEDKFTMPPGLLQFWGHSPLWALFRLQ